MAGFLSVSKQTNWGRNCSFNTQTAVMVQNSVSNGAVFSEMWKMAHSWIRALVYIGSLKLKERIQNEGILIQQL